jgi:3-deoxy-D-manno-octulosonic-acid transferase
MVLDLRTRRILKRLENAPTVLRRISHYREKLESLPKSQRIIIGSAYPQEMEIFKNPKLVKSLKEKKVHIAIAPHKLDHFQEIMGKIPESLKVLAISENTPLEELPEVSIILIPGILCELYSLFGHAFVGGGHHRSIHSVLEPHLALCQVYCGPRHGRSTEIDFILEKSPGDIGVIFELEEFYDKLNPEEPKAVMEQTQKSFEELLAKLES